MTKDIPRTPEEKAQAVIDRHGELRTIRQDYESLWRDVIDFCAIKRFNLDGTKQAGSKVGVKIYDDTAPLALKDWADGLFGYLMSPATQWFKLQVRPEWLMEDRSVKVWLEEVARQLYASLARSNFYEVTPEFLQDGGSIGTATMYCEEDLGGRKAVFTVCHPGEVFIAENRYGQVDTVFRNFKKTSRQSIQEFGENPELSEDLKENWQTQPDTEHEFIHAVFPNDDLQMYYESGRMMPKIGRNNKPFVSRYVQVGQTKLISDSGYNSFPYLVWRCRKNTKEMYGRSPAGDAIVSILTSNQFSRTLINAAQNEVEPPWAIPEEMRTSGVHLYARGKNYYGKDRERIPIALNRGINYPVGEEREIAIRRSIERHFMVEFFSLLSRAAMEGRQLTVPQVMEMQGEKAILLGTVVGRLTSEFLDPVIDRVFEIEERFGNIPPPPPILAKYAGSPLEIDYMGPLAQAQRRLFKTQGIVQAIESSRTIIELFPDTRDNIDADEALRVIFDATGAPAKTVRDKDEVMQTREARARQMQQDKAAESLLATAEAVPKISQQVEPNSPLAMLSGMEEGAQ